MKRILLTSLGSGAIFGVFMLLAVIWLKVPAVTVIALTVMVMGATHLSGILVYGIGDVSKESDIDMDHAYEFEREE